MTAAGSRPVAWARSDAAVVVAVGLVVAVVVLGPALGPGSLFTLDMVTSPHPVVGSGIWGLGPEIPRATPFAELLAVVSWVVPAWMVIDAVMAGSLVLAYAGIFRRTADCPPVIGHGAALLYAAGPFVVTRLGVGHLSMVAAMALLPWAVPVLLQPGRDRCSTLRWSAALGVTGAYGGILAGLAVGVGALADVVGDRATAGPRRALAGLATSGGAWLVGQLPWLVPGVIVLSQVPSVVDASAFPSGVESVPGAAELLAGHGFWQEPFQIGTDQPTVLVAGAGLVLAGAAAVGTIGATRWMRRASVIGAASVLLVLAEAAAPTRGLFESLSGAGPLSVLREPHRYLVLYLVWAVPAAATAAANVARRSEGIAGRVALVGPLAVALVLAAPGAWSAGGLLVRADYPASWSQARARVDAEPGTVLALPWARYLDVSFADGRRVFNPVYGYFGDDVLVSGNIGLGDQSAERADPRNEVIDELRSVMLDTGQVSGRLAELGVRWVILIREASHLRYQPLFTDPGLAPVIDAPELVLFHVAGWRGPAVDVSGRAVDVDRILPPLVRIASSEPAVWNQAASTGWLQGDATTRANVAGLVQLPGGSTVVWYWPSLLVVAGDVISLVALAWCLHPRRRGNGMGRENLTMHLVARILPDRSGRFLGHGECGSMDGAASNARVAHRAGARRFVLAGMFALVVSCSLMVGLGASSASAQCTVSAADYTTGGVLDLEGYLAAVQVCGAVVTRPAASTAGQLSVTGRNLATVIAYGVAFVIVGGAVVAGARMRRHGDELI